MSAMHFEGLTKHLSHASSRRATAKGLGALVLGAAPAIALVKGVVADNDNRCKRRCERRCEDRDNPDRCRRRCRRRRCRDND